MIEPAKKCNLKPFRILRHARMECDERPRGQNLLFRRGKENDATVGPFKKESLINYFHFFLQGKCKTVITAGEIHPQDFAALHRDIHRWNPGPRPAAARAEATTPRVSECFIFHTLLVGTDFHCLPVSHAGEIGIRAFRLKSIMPADLPSPRYNSKGIQIIHK